MKKIVIYLTSLFVITLILLFAFPLLKIEDTITLEDAVVDMGNADQLSYQYDASGTIRYNLVGNIGEEVSFSSVGDVMWDEHSSELNYFAHRQRDVTSLSISDETFYNIGQYMIKQTATNEEPELTFLEVNELSQNYLNENQIPFSILKEIIANEGTYARRSLFDSNYIIKNKYYLGAQTIARLFGLKEDNNILDIIAQSFLIDIDINIKIQSNAICQFSISARYDYEGLIIRFDYDQILNEFNQDLFVMPANDFIATEQESLLIQTTIQSAIQEVLSSTSFGYDFIWKSEVDAGMLYPSLGLHLRGNHKQTTMDDIIFFNNYYELDSDYKPDLPDVKKYRVMLNNTEKEVWDEIVIAIFANDFFLIDDYSVTNEQTYMLIDFIEMLEDIDFYITVSSEEGTAYKLPISKNHIQNVMDKLQDFLVFQIYDIVTEFNIDDIDFTVTFIEEGSIFISLIIEGSYIDSDDKMQYLDIEYAIELYKLENENIYVPPTTKEDIS